MALLTSSLKLCPVELALWKAFTVDSSDLASATWPATCSSRARQYERRTAAETAEERQRQGTQTNTGRNGGEGGTGAAGQRTEAVEEEEGGWTVSSRGRCLPTLRAVEGLGDELSCRSC